MKRKILTALLITIVLITSFSTLTSSVKAKVLEDYEDNWQDYWTENWIGNEESEEIIEFDTIDDYLNATYENYANINKNEITRLFIEGFDVYAIKDLSGLYQFPNLTELEIYYLANDDALKTVDLSQLSNLKKLAVYGEDINDLGIDKLSDLTYLVLRTENDEFNLDLTNFNKLKHFSFGVNTTLTENDKTEDELLNIIKQQIIPLEGYEVIGYVDLYEDYEGIRHFTATFNLIEPINIEISTNKVNYNLGDTVTTKFSWDRGIQATDFEILFDSSKLKLNTSSIGEDFFNLVEPGRIIVSWASFEEKDITGIDFEFSAIGSGETELVILPENFADGELDTDFLFTDEAKYSINIEKSVYIQEGASIETNIINNKETITGLTLNNNKVTLEDFLAEENFVSNLEVKAFNNKDEEITDTSKGLGTGSKIRLYENNELVKEYSVVVYGDTTGEGEITAFDALTLIKAINKKYQFSDEIFLEAGRIISSEGTEPTAIDALAIVKHLNKKYTINQ